FGVDPIAIDRSVNVLRVDQTFRYHLEQGAASGLSALLRIEVMLWVDPAFPFQPELARVLGIQVVLDFETEFAREILRAFADNEMMVRLLHDRFRDQRRRADALDASYAAGAPFRSVHATGIELHDPVRIRQSTVAHAVIERIELHD